MSTRPVPYSLLDCAELIFSIRKTPVAEVLRQAVRVGTHLTLEQRHGIRYNGWHWKQKTVDEVRHWSVPKSKEANAWLESSLPSERIPTGALHMGHGESVANLTRRCRDANSIEEVVEILEGAGWIIQTANENWRVGAKNEGI